MTWAKVIIRPELDLDLLAPRDAITLIDKAETLGYGDPADGFEGAGQVTLADLAAEALRIIFTDTSGPGWLIEQDFGSDGWTVTVEIEP